MRKTKAFAQDDLFVFADRQQALLHEQETRLESRLKAQIDLCLSADRISYEDARTAILDSHSLSHGQTKGNFSRRVGAYSTLQHLVLECRSLNVAPDNLPVAVKLLNSPESPLPRQLQTVDSRG